MKVGDIALKDGILVKITAIEYTKIPITKTKRLSWRKFVEEETGEFENKLKLVWWRKVGDNITPEGISTTNYYSTEVDWENLIMKADIIINQVKYEINNR